MLSLRLDAVDFLIVRNQVPWMLLEAKWSDGPIAAPHRKIQAMLKGIPFVQVCRQEGICLMEDKSCYRISASRFF